ncbi:MAG TPA: RluA family pseudouridine synthase [Deltaproteobacteria bacterium]|nr:RluA family pseudouridine synthase [Deltaproteobacteria bacterium]
MSNDYFTVPVTSVNAGIASDVLAEHTGISKAKVKDAMNKGAVWLKRAKGRRMCLRRAKAQVVSGDTLELYYDPQLLALTPGRAECLADHDHYSVWYKPAGLLTQGTNFGDHCSLLRQAELYFVPRREVFLVHRLDREASGLVILAHSRTAAAKLSALFQQGLVEKHYRIEVLGDLSGKTRGVIDLPIDTKEASTVFEVIKYDPGSHTSLVDVQIKTGRLHQIRRHFSMIGFPVMGDPRYGRGNKNEQGMMLEAVSLAFECPFLHKRVMAAGGSFQAEIVKHQG